MKVFNKGSSNAVPLGPNAVNPFTEKNSGDNTGRHIPWMEGDIIKDLSYIEILAVLKKEWGEVPSLARTLTPGEGLKRLAKMVLEAIYEGGARPCPPLVIGVEIGPTADIAI